MQANPVSRPTNSQSGYRTPPSGYQSSVPVTVYRELAAELQSTQAKLSFFQLQNEQLGDSDSIKFARLKAIGSFSRD